MKTLLSTTALLLTLGFSSAALANNTEWYGKEGQDMNPTCMEDAIRSLPKDDATEFRATMKEAREGNNDIQGKIEKLHGDLHAILTADTFEKDLYLSKRNELQQLHDQMETNMAIAFASAVDGLTQKERVTLTRSLHHGHPAKHHRLTKKTRSKYPAQPKAPIADTSPANDVKK